MEEDPKLTLALPEHYIPDAWQDLWREALTSQEEDLRRQAATSLLRLGQENSTISADMKAALLTGFRTAGNRTVRHAMAAALVELEVHEAAADLFEFSESGNITVARTVEPALGRWQYEPIVDVWLKRIHNPSKVSVTHLVLAAEGLALVNRTDAVTGLLQLVTDERIGTEVRMAAAAALGSLANSGLTETAGRLAADQTAKGFSNRLAAAKMLSGHREPSAGQLLQSLALDSRPVIAVTALVRLLEIDTSYVHAMVDQLLSNSDAQVRQLAAESIASHPSSKGVSQLAELLTDPDPRVRNVARNSLVMLTSDDSLKEQLLNRIDQLLTEDDWRGLEQACRLTGQLDHEPAAQRLLELLNHSRMEVQITAAWALRMVAVPNTVPEIEAFIAKTIAPLPSTAGLPSGAILTRRQDDCLMHLFEAVGQARSSSAVPSLLKCVPKRKDMGSQSRAAAVWALGHIYQNNPPDELVQQLISRMSDSSPLNPEYESVRMAAAISLGRMKLAAVVTPMKVAMQRMAPSGRIHVACEWAIAQITGTSQPPPAAQRIPPRNPFLRSVGP